MPLIFGHEDQRIGKVSHMHGMGSDSQIIVDVGGFLGIGAKSVMLAAKDLTFMRDDDGTVHGMTPWTKEQVKALPEHTHQACHRLCAPPKHPEPEPFMPKTAKKKPGKAAGPRDAKSASSVTGAFDPGQTKPTDAGRASAATGGKGASSKKGR